MKKKTTPSGKKPERWPVGSVTADRDSLYISNVKQSSVFYFLRP